jgi:2-dehydro-3-deoxygluconokinase
MTATGLAVKGADECELDIVSLGEVMLRLDPGDRRVRTARSFDVWEGGGEYNVARGLSRCFGLRAAVVTALADNEVGHLVENLILGGGVDADLVRWFDVGHDGAEVRNGLNFTERGYGVRGAVGVSDRRHTAVAQMRPGDVDWSDLFDRRGVRWLHTGGIFTALSPSTAEVAHAAITAAKRSGTVVSYDLNHRPSLWRGSQERLREVNLAIADLVDVMIGNEEDFIACLGYEVPGVDERLAELPTAGFRSMISSVGDDHPGIAVIATTLRAVRSASRNDWGAVGWSRASGFCEATNRPDLEVLDRVGGGDSFASGLIYALLAGFDLPTAVEYGAAHGALAMTTPGDTSMVSRADVERLVAGAGARVVR